MVSHLIRCIAINILNFLHTVFFVFFFGDRAYTSAEDTACNINVLRANVFRFKIILNIISVELEVMTMKGHSIPPKAQELELILRYSLVSYPVHLFFAGFLPLCIFKTNLISNADFKTMQFSDTWNFKVRQFSCSHFLALCWTNNYEKRMGQAALLF